MLPAVKILKVEFFLILMQNSVFVLCSGVIMLCFSFQEQVYECLANSQCCGQSSGCTNRPEQLYTEVLVKLADISKAFAMNNCSGNTSAYSYFIVWCQCLSQYYKQFSKRVVQKIIDLDLMRLF